VNAFSLAQQNPRDDLIITTTRRLIIIELNLCILSLCLFILRGLIISFFMFRAAYLLN